PKPPSALFCLVLVNRLSPRETRFLSACGDLRNTSTNASAKRRENSGTRFAYRSLFRLQVKMADEHEHQNAPQIITLLLRREAFFDERLQAYATAIRSRIGAAFSSESTFVASICHPFYPTDAAVPSPSFSAVRLRHLLALNEQNEGVISEVFTQIDSM